MARNLLGRPGRGSVTCPSHVVVGRCRMVAVAGTTTHLVDQGSGHPVVLVHGSQASAYTWRHQVGPLTAAGYRVVAVDLPGSGSSSLEVSDPSVEGLSAFLLALLDSLGLERASFVASSGGALPVLDLAIRHPQRVNRLVLSSPCGVPHPVPWLWRQVTRPFVGEAAGLLMSRRLVRSALRDAVHDRTRITDEVVEAYYRPLRRRRAWAAQLGLERASRPAWVEEHLDDVSVPTLLVWGEDDPWHPPEMVEEFRRRMPRTSVRLIPGCGHLPHEERPEAFNAAALGFLAAGVG